MCGATPWGAPRSITGPLDARFPGQWFQLESGLHYNWHRHYDPTLGRYTQPDPLGFVDAPSVYGHVRGSPFRYVDPSGRLAIGEDAAASDRPKYQCPTKQNLFAKLAHLGAALLQGTATLEVPPLKSIALDPYAE